MEYDYSHLPEAFDLFVEEVDKTLMTEIEANSSLWAWFQFYDSPVKPLNPREFLHFWSALSGEEQLDYVIFTPDELLGK